MVVEKDLRVLHLDPKATRRRLSSIVSEEETFFSPGKSLGIGDFKSYLHSTTLLPTRKPSSNKAIPPNSSTH